MTKSTGASKVDQSLVSGLAYTGTVRWACQMMSWVSTLAIMRVLDPSDYGLIGMANIAIGAVAMVSDLGLNGAIVAKHGLDLRHLRQLNSFALLVACVAFVMTCAASPAIAAFFGQVELRTLLPALSTTLLLTALQTVPSAALQKELHFRWLALVDGCQAILHSGTTIILAYLGFGYWSLAIGALCGAVVAAALVLVRRRYGFSVPRRADLADVLTLSWHLFVCRVAWFAQSNADFLIVGKVLGPTALGEYTVGWTIASMPVEKVSSLMLRVTPAVFAAVQNDRDKLRTYFLRMTETTAIVTMPIAIGLALTAEPLVQLVLGTKWAAAIAPLQILAVLAGLRVIVGFMPQVMNVTGASRANMINSLFGSVLLPVGFLIGSQWGSVGVAASWCVTFPMLLALPLWCVLGALQIPLMKYANAVWTGFSSTIIMAMVVLLAGAVAVPSSSPAVTLLCRVAIGVIAYCAVFSLLHIRRLKLLVEYLQSVRRRATSA